ncbi:MAG: hypothetical protein JWQ74_1316 [Marmoricola sp.]|nr:hypothetical protein [Marmoricola sp.]
MRLSRDEVGTAIVEFVWLAILLLVPMLYVLLSVFEVQRSAYAASAAARSASRAFVTSPDQVAGLARARAAAGLAFADQGIRSGFGLVVACRPDPDRCLVPGSVVTVRIEARAPLPLLPSFLGGEAPAVAVRAEHRSPYGTFREARP